MVRLRALMAWADRKPGDEWDADDESARILSAPDLPGGQKAEIVNRIMTVENSPPLVEPEPPPVEEPVPTKRRYLRRDMLPQK